MSKLAWIGGSIVAAAVYCWSATAQQPSTTYPLPGAASHEHVTHFYDQPNGPTILTMVDPQTSALAVYHITRETGEIKLKSVRNFQLDLRLSNFNGGSPTPEEIQKMFDRQL
jgi:hypothetical protein